MGNQLHKDFASRVVSPLRKQKTYCDSHCICLAGFQTLFLLGYLFLSGLLSMSQYVAKSSFCAVMVCLNHSTLQNENRWNPNKSYSVGGEHLSPTFPSLIATGSHPT